MSDTPVTIPRSVSRRLRAQDGRDYRLQVAWPAEPPPPAGFPVIYALDAHVVFGTMVESARMRARRPDATGVAPAVIVGVGYPDTEPALRERRLADYTPAASGGAAETFLDFIDRRVKPEVERSLAIDRGRQTLFGHSLGGLFVLHTLLTSPASFRHYVAVSPSIWYARDHLFDGAGAVAREPVRAQKACRVLITVGEYEQALAPWQTGSDQARDEIAGRRSSRRMIDDARALAERLRGVCGDARFALLDGEDHASAVLRSVGECLRFGAAPDRAAASLTGPGSDD